MSDPVIVTAISSVSGVIGALIKAAWDKTKGGHGHHDRHGDRRADGRTAMEDAIAQRADVTHQRGDIGSGPSHA